MGRDASTGPQWLEGDVQKVIAYRAYMANLCPECGTANEDWVDEKSRFLEHPEWEWHTHRCYGCSEKELLRKSIPSNELGVHIVRQKHLR